MKKVLFLFVVLFIVSVTVCASDDFLTISNLIDLGLEENASRIAAIAPNLSFSEKAILYNSNKINAGLPFAVNCLVGLGIGSYIQGDTVGGTIALVGELGSLAILGAGYALAFSNALDESSWFDIALAYAGFASYSAFKIFELIRPFTYASNYNKKLSASLNGTPSFAVVPTINENNEFAMTMMASISY